MPLLFYYTFYINSTERSKLNNTKPWGNCSIAVKYLKVPSVKPSIKASWNVSMYATWPKVSISQKKYQKLFVNLTLLLWKWWIVFEGWSMHVFLLYCWLEYEFVYYVNFKYIRVLPSRSSKEMVTKTMCITVRQLRTVVQLLTFSSLKTLDTKIWAQLILEVAR